MHWEKYSIAGIGRPSLHSVEWAWHSSIACHLGKEGRERGSHKLICDPTCTAAAPSLLLTDHRAGWQLAVGTGTSSLLTEPGELEGRGGNRH